MQTSSWQKIGLNSIWLLLGRVGSQILMLLFTIFIARIWGNTGLGQVAFITAILFVGNVFSTFGLDTYLIRATARSQQNDKTQLTTVLLTQLILSSLFISGLIIVGPWLPGQTAVTKAALLIASLALFPLAVVTVGSAVLRGRERMELVMLIHLTTALTQTTGTFFIVGRSHDLRLLALWLVITQSIGAGLAWLLCQRTMPSFGFGRPASRPAWQNILQQTLPLALLMSLAVVYQRLGIFTLSVMADEATLGLFTAAARLIEGAKLIPYAVAGALFPVLTRYPLQDLYRSQLGLGIGVAILAAAILTLLAPWLIPFLYGSGYETAVLPLQILSWSLPFFVVTLFHSTKLVARQQEIKAVVALLIVLPITAVLSVFGWQQWQMAGLCSALVLGESLQAMVLIGVSKW